LEHLDAETLAALREWVRKDGGGRAGRRIALLECDLEFHKASSRASDMPALMPILERCSLYGHRFKMTQTSPARTLAETASRHWAIVDALERKDAADLERIVAHHVLSVIGDPPAAVPADTQRRDLRMSPTMQVIFDRIAREDRHLPNPMAIPVAEARRQFVQTTERWNTFDRKRHDRSPCHSGVGHEIPALRIAKRADGRRGRSAPARRAGVFGSTETHLGARRGLRNSRASRSSIDLGARAGGAFPEGLNDCTAAWRWLNARKRELSLASPWFLAGDSAGANLALALARSARRGRNAARRRFAVLRRLFSTHDRILIEPVVADSSTHQREDGVVQETTISAASTDPSDPRFARVADLAGLRALSQCGRAGSVRDDGALLARRLAEAGARFEFKMHEGVNHGFMQMSSELPEALTAFKDAATFIHPFLRPRQEKNQRQEA
jgi:acetyl esterase/lipase